MSIHPTAVIDSKAEIAAGVEIGAYVVIEGRVRDRPRHARHGARVSYRLD